MTLSASKSAFMPALALHNATHKATTKPNVSLPSLLAAMRMISSRSTSSVPAGTISVAMDRCLAMVPASANKAYDDTPAAIAGNSATSDERIERDASGECQQAVLLDLAI